MTTGSVAVRDLISRRIEELGDLTMADVSRQLGRNPTYIQQFISKGVPQELDEVDREVLARILRVSSEELRGPGRARRARKLYAPIRERLASLVETMPKINNPRGGWGPPFRDLPVFRAVQDGKVLTMASRPSAHLDVPQSMGLGEKAYCVVIADDSMAPELRFGSTAIVDPALEPKANTTCLFRAKDADRNVIVVRRLREVRADAYAVYAYRREPVRARDEVLPKKAWDAHVIVGNLFFIA